MALISCKQAPEITIGSVVLENQLKAKLLEAFVLPRRLGLSYSTIPNITVLAGPLRDRV